MKRTWISVLVIALVLALPAGQTAVEAKSRAAKKSAKGKTARSKKGARAKSARRASKRERRKEVARRGKRGRKNYARSRRSRRSTDVAQEAASPSTPRAVASGISSERVIEIQNALIKAGYFEGPASGQYDEATANAMKQFQAANGFRATGLPSAHALKKLGVAKRSDDSYAVPVNRVAQDEKRL